MAAVCVLPVPAPLKRQRSHSSPQAFRTFGASPAARALVGRVRGATLTGTHRPSSALSTTPSSARRAPGASAFAELPLELLVHILLFARTDRTTARALSLVSATARRYVLPALFSVQILRTHDAAQAFLARVAGASMHTPLGALVQALWLSDTGVWPAGLVRAVLGACPHTEKLALTGFTRLLPTPPFSEFTAWAQDGTDAPLFAAGSIAGRPLELTLVGHVDPVDVARLRAMDPRTFAALTRRLRVLRMLQPRSLFYTRLAGTSGPAPGQDQHSTPSCAMAALLLACPNIEQVSIPLAQLVRYVPPFGLDFGAPSEPHFTEELEMLKGWLAAAAGAAPVLAKVGLLVDPRGRMRAVAEGEPAHVVGSLTAGDVEQLKKRAAEIDGRAKVVEWPRNVDAARDAWRAEIDGV